MKENLDEWIMRDQIHNDVGNWSCSSTNFIFKLQQQIS